MKKKVGRPSVKGETTPINMRVRKGLVDKINLCSRYSGLNKTQICERIIEEGLNKFIKDNKNEITRWNKLNKKNKENFNSFHFFGGGNDD